MKSFIENIKRMLITIYLLLIVATIDRSLHFRSPKKLALISGAGIAGLAASFELLARGFNVVIVEKRSAFERFNVINLDVETQRFLEKFSLLEEFEKDIAGRISTHETVLSKADDMEFINSDDVSKLEPSRPPFKHDNLHEFFKRGGIYSVSIKDLQTFLAKKALAAGAHIFGNVEIEVIARTEARGVSEVLLTGGDASVSHPLKLQPDLLFVAEGAHTTTAKQLGMTTTEVPNKCTGENWIFGNAKYVGTKTFVVSMIDTSQESLEIANIIFNAKIRKINIAITSESNLNQEQIKNRILKIMKMVFHYKKLGAAPESLISAVKRPVQVKNEHRSIYSRGNVFIIGDAAGHSSPLAGLGGTLGLTLVPHAIEQLLNDLKLQPQKMNLNFNEITEAYISRWITKSDEVKRICLGFFDKKVARLADMQPRQEPVLVPQ